MMLTDLDAGTSYIISVRAISASGKGPPSMLSSEVRPGKTTKAHGDACCMLRGAVDDLQLTPRYLRLGIVLCCKQANYLMHPILVLLQPT